MHENEAEEELRANHAIAIVKCQDCRSHLSWSDLGKITLGFVPNSTEPEHGAEYLVSMEYCRVEMKPHEAPARPSNFSNDCRKAPVLKRVNDKLTSYGHLTLAAGTLCSIISRAKLISNEVDQSLEGLQLAEEAPDVSRWVLSRGRIL